MQMVVGSIPGRGIFIRYEDPFAKQKAIEKLGHAKQKVREMRNKLEGVGKKMPAGTLLWSNAGLSVSLVQCGNIFWVSSAELSRFFTHYTRLYENQRELPAISSEILYCHQRM